MLTRRHLLAGFSLLACPTILRAASAVVVPEPSQKRITSPISVSHAGIDGAQIARKELLEAHP
ncbi:hypothetical protein BwSH20_75400 [Bradyrhizobium ottawaense]|jgi:hypothetical protein|uniref:Uncharacterized protein n=1 Tax=Bradyrhizobium ottawaense TaxID=931866 RepID=A0A2U8P276_9BRAD|nr:hypothetical protein CIT37_05625 [Bradyrhizobium ottawaense]GMO10729.1 hypothetical protein BwSH20_75400 [Bradyrhizobium ottawaense]GMO47565.1 hypothetical protein BwSH14_65420 [Bradyrhizobium ottawaense]GMO47732.1 hypothetical protein BwSF21_65630 [Bradyrhizobium ottawaense]GMO56303.1 hypothetical protein BwSF21_78040 [Bradyrhizobium ottawaense]